YVVVQEAVWEGLANRIGGDALAKDPRFAKIADRRKNQDEMWKLITEFAKNYTKREFMAILNPLDVPCGPIMSTEDLANERIEDRHELALGVVLRELGDELPHFIL